MKQLFSLLATLLLVGVQYASATHIVGGELVYSYLGNSQYAITLVVYRDCFGGQAPFDNPAAIGVFDSNGFLLQNLSFTLDSVVTVQSSINSSCVTVPNSVCTEAGYYTDIVTLPPTSGGYTIAYQRCCMNSVVQNVLNPGDVGATYVATIPGTGSSPDNSSPVWNSLPPLYVCANLPWQFNHSAFDSDGDSLVYSLCTPYGGADVVAPQPNPPAAPPYTPIIWQTPYSQNDMMGGAPLTINPLTGELNATPNAIGTYVIGMCVREYRNGVLLGEIGRSIQVNVVNCQTPVASPDDLNEVSLNSFVNCTEFVEFSATNSAGFNIWWDFGDPTTTLDQSAQQNPNWTYPGPGTYDLTLVVYNPINPSDPLCTDTTVQQVTIQPLVLANAGADTSTCSGIPVQIGATAMSGWTYLWSPTTGLSNPNVSNPTVLPTVLTEYVVLVTDASGCSNTDTVSVDVSLVSLSPPDVTETDAICTSDNGTATATPIDGTAPYFYQWDDPASQSTQTALNLAAGTYNVTVTDAGGCQSTNSVVIGVDQGDLVVSVSNFTDALCNGSCDGDATAATQGGTGPYQFVWDDPSSQQTAQATNLCAGTYNVGVADVNGCSATDQVIVGEPTAVTLSAVMDAQSNCAGSDGQATVSASGGTVAVDYSYSWNSTPIQTTGTAIGLAAATYTVTVTDDNGCSESVDVEVTPIPAYSATILSYSDASCHSRCDGEATVQASMGNTPPISYSWSTIPVQNTAEATGLCAGNYDVTVTDSVGCVGNATVTIGQPVKLTADASVTDDSICIGESTDLMVELTGGTVPYVGYSWTASPSDSSLNEIQQNQTVSPLVTTTYTIVGSDTNGCFSDPVDVDVVVFDPLVLSFQRPLFSSDTGICPYDFAVIDLAAIGGDGDYTYYLLPDLMDSLSLPMQVQPDTTTTYDFMVRDGCTTPPALASSTITVFQLPQVDFTVEPPNGCDELTTIFTDHTTPMPIRWDWNFGDENSNANLSTVQNPSHKFSGPGVYSISLSVESADGCVSDSVKVDYVEVYPLPLANFYADPQTTTLIEGNGTVSFTDRSNGDILTWSWTFGTGDTSLEQNPEYSYYDTGHYTVTLLVIDDHGCTDSTSRKVIIEPDFTFYVPNSFSPNSDGRNDYFRGYGEGVDWDTYEMSIFDRWGEKIFYTNDVENPWNGWYENKQVPNDVYVWVIDIYDLNGGLHSFNGHVTLLR